jgi:hypothetical protein
MGAWLKETGSEIGAESYADPGPFTTDISEGKGSLFYKAHSYPTKVPYQAIMRFILHYTNPGDVVLDGFCGSGMAGLAAQRAASQTQKQEQKLRLSWAKFAGARGGPFFKTYRRQRHS